MSCRVCKTPYLDSPRYRTPRYNIYKRERENDSISTRFSNVVGMKLEPDPDKSTSMCRPCHSKLVTVEKANKILVEWRGENQTIENSVCEKTVSTVYDFSISPRRIFPY